ncbi:MAG: hypothetical protein WCP11_02660 [Candidatus Saccharibacteria bacterium]
MNKKQSQSGSAHLVVIIVLVAALLGALGFVFYQNFMVAKTETPAPVVVDDGRKTLSIAEWGVKGKYTSRETLTYAINQSGGFRVYSSGFVNDASTASCGSAIIRLNADDTLNDSFDRPTVAQYYTDKESSIGSSHMKKVGDKYFLMRGDVNCGADSGDVSVASEEGKIDAALGEIMLSLEAL